MFMDVFPAVPLPLMLPLPYVLLQPWHCRVAPWQLGVGTKYREPNRNYREPNRNIRFHVRFRVFKNQSTEVNTETEPNLPKVPKLHEI
jgi:hypothetical protein